MKLTSLVYLIMVSCSAALHAQEPSAAPDQTATSGSVTNETSADATNTPAAPLVMGDLFTNVIDMQLVKSGDSWVGKYEVTQKQYQAVMDSNPSQFTGETRPVDSVSWQDAMSFCQKLTDMELNAPSNALPKGFYYTRPHRGRMAIPLRRRRPQGRHHQPAHAALRHQSHRQPWAEQSWPLRHARERPRAHPRRLQQTLPRPTRRLLGRHHRDQPPPRIPRLRPARRIKEHLRLPRPFEENGRRRQIALAPYRVPHHHTYYMVAFVLRTLRLNSPIPSSAPPPSAARPSSSQSPPRQSPSAAPPPTR